MGPLPKNGGPNLRSFWFWMGLPWGPLRPPPPPGQILGACLLHDDLKFWFCLYFHQLPVLHKCSLVASLLIWNIICAILHKWFMMCIVLLLVLLYYHSSTPVLLREFGLVGMSLGLFWLVISVFIYLKLLTILPSSVLVLCRIHSSVHLDLVLFSFSLS